MDDLMKQRSQLVVKHNDLIQRGKNNLTLTQQKLIAYIISLIKPTDTELKKYEINVSDFCELCGIDRNYFYSEFKDIIDDIDNKAFWIETEEKVFKFRWFLKAEYIKHQGKVLLLLDDDIKDYLLGMKERYTAYELYNILAMKSKYSVSVYELYKSYSYKTEQTFDIDTLKDLLSASHYTNFKDFRTRVLEVAIKDINQYTDLFVSYDVIKRGRKVVKVKFNIKKKQALERLQGYYNTIDVINKRNNQIKGQISMFDKSVEEMENE